MHKGRIIYAVVLVVIFYLAMIYYDYGMYLLFFLSLLIPLFAEIYGFLLRKRILFAWGETGSDGSRTEPVRIAVAMKNTGILPTGKLKIRYSVKDVLRDSTEQFVKTIVIAGGSTRTDVLEIEPMHSGKLTVSVDSVRVYEPLGLVSYAVPTNLGGNSYLILPELTELPVSPWENNPYAYVSEETYSETKPGDDPSELFGTRDYVPGDRQNRIHWKLTAKQDALIVKEYGLPIACTTTVFLELFSCEEDEWLNTLLDAAFSLSFNLILGGHVHRFVWYDTKNGCVRRMTEDGEEALSALISEVLGCSLYEKDQAVIRAYEEEFVEERCKNIFYLAPTLTAENREALEKLMGDAYVTVYTIGDKNRVVLREAFKEYAVRPWHLSSDMCGMGGDEG